MKVLFISGREPTYVRNAVILKGLKLCGYEIVNCSDTSTSYPVRYVKNVLKFLLWKRDWDVVFVGFFGQPLVPLISLFTSKPVIYDAFLSAYDTLCFDRKIFRPSSLAGRVLFWLDKYSCQRATRIFLDTNAHIEYFVQTFGVPKEKLNRLFVGADEAVFYPREVARDPGTFRVFYYATYLPLHGIEYIIRAAKRLERFSGIEFEIVGKGPQYKSIRDMARSMEVRNVWFHEWVPYEELPIKIAEADICLGGHFSDIEKAKRVIPGKTFQYIAMGKPVIVGDCPGNRELFTNRQNALFVNMADADALAAAIVELKNDVAMRRKIAEEGHRIFAEKCNNSAIGRELKKAIEGLQKS